MVVNASSKKIHLRNAEKIEQKVNTFFGVIICIVFVEVHIVYHIPIIEDTMNRGREWEREQDRHRERDRYRSRSRSGEPDRRRYVESCVCHILSFDGSIMNNQ